MRFLTPLAAVLALAATPALAQSPNVSVTVGGELQNNVRELGDRDVQRQADRLAQTIGRVLGDGDRAELVLTDLKPNRPTFRQVADQPGLDPIRSRSIGGATIEGVIITADGRRIPVNYDWYTVSIADVWGYGTWDDAERAYSRLATRIQQGRPVS